MDTMGKTGEVTYKSELWGDKLYQSRARLALPLLVRQAKAEQHIYYSDLASELGMPNPRNLNYPLGTIGDTMNKLGEEWGIKIPPIQCVVVNKSTGIPGEGIGWFIADKEQFYKSSRRQKRKIIEKMLDEVYRFELWDKVLEELGLEPAPEPSMDSIDDMVSKHYGSGGESEDHRQLKEYVSRNPHLVKLPSSVGFGETEYLFRSGDALDVLFKHKKDWVGVEVKSKISDIDDITRGIFQCVKYQALMEATQRAENKKPNSRMILLLESIFPAELIPLKNTLGIEVVDQIRPK